MRLIDADAIHYCSYDLDNYHSFSAVTDDDIAEMPTIDAVEVVRCKDCKHSRPTEWYRAKLKCCHSSHGCSQVPYEVPFDHFCSYGERRDNENTV